MSLADSSQPIPVAIGLIRRGSAYLIRQRPPGSIMAGVWEFPGGKREPGEALVETVVRECLEETGLDVRVERQRRVVEHRYPHGFVRLHYFDCRPILEGAEPNADAGFRWVDAADLGGFRFPEANETILEELAREREPKPSGRAPEGIVPEASDQPIRA